MRLSRNWVISQIATIFIEFVRNIPLLLQIFIWYAAVLKPLAGTAPGAGTGASLSVLGHSAVRAPPGGRHLCPHQGLSRLSPLGTPVSASASASSSGWWLIWSLLGRLGLSVIEFVPMNMFLSNRGILVPAPIFEAGSQVRFMRSSLR
jgi:hypothetical protein